MSDDIQFYRECCLTGAKCIDIVQCTNLFHTPEDAISYPGNNIFRKKRDDMIVAMVVTIRNADNHHIVILAIGRDYEHGEDDVVYLLRDIVEYTCTSREDIEKFITHDKIKMDEYYEFCTQVSNTSVLCRLSMAFDSTKFIVGIEYETVLDMRKLTAHNQIYIVHEFMSEYKCESNVRWKLEFIAALLVDVMKNIESTYNFCHVLVDKEYPVAFVIGSMDNGQLNILFMHSLDKSSYKYKYIWDKLYRTQHLTADTVVQYTPGYQSFEDMKQIESARVKVINHEPTKLIVEIA